MASMKLIQGDCLEALKVIPDKSINLVIADPPYLHVKGGMKSKRLNVGVRDANSQIVTSMSDFGRAKIYEFLNTVKNKMVRVNMYVFCSKLQIVHYLNWAIENKLQYDVLFWYKDTTRMISTKFYASNIEYIVRIYGKGASLKKRVKENGKAKSELYQKFFIYPTPKVKVYEAQKPIEIIEKMVEVSSDPGDIVLDPYMGSGTTGVACKHLGRDFIGIELEKDIYDTAKNRIEVD